jgi:hypothetical protein
MQIMEATFTIVAVRKPNHCINKSTILSKYPFWNLRRKKKGKATTYTFSESEEQLVNFGEDIEIGKESVLQSGCSKYDCIFWIHFVEEQVDADGLPLGLSNLSFFLL